MARTKAISLVNGANKVELAEVSGLVIQNIQKDTLASGLKSQSYTGNPTAGSVEYKRVKNAVSQEYGTARAAAKGDNIDAAPVTVNLDTHREIVEEAAKFDLDTVGVGNVMARRGDSHTDAVVAELDTAFFQCGKDAGTAFTPAQTELAKVLEELIQAVETTKNDYTRGVPRHMIRVVCSPSFYGDIRELLDTKSNPNVDTAAEEFGTYHGVRFYSNVFMPADVKAEAMVEGAIAQPVVVYPYAEPEKIPMSNDYAISMFYDYGTKALSPDLIYVYSAA